ncbi:hypothetical protein JMF97_29160 [Micromonospora fiedleri]|uniref:Cas3 C-terminal domain-containing protein n=1 Tax=Micromonospora fiedleri TaxID=1157498 RepID=A0ABS1UX33_9ACTN|nr:hypothetical protein [Micromonospora fiedleri]MBL6280238.1 hypothetical protein [Micromonospora fiedleri]
MDEHEAIALPSSVDVIVLRTENDRTIPVAGSRAVDLSVDQPPTADLLSELMDAIVRVRADDGHLPVVLEELRTIAVPPAFAASPWLAHCRPVVIRNDVGRAGALSVRYSDHGGLRISDPETNDDGDDQDG